MSMAVSWLAPILGISLVAVVLVDVFLTVLMPASGHGPLREPLSRAVWAVFLGTGRRLSQRHRRQLLSYSGPVLISATILVWVMLLALGWALIYWPALGTSITASRGPTDKTFATAVYVSGFMLTTLGTGDVVPVTGLYRLLAVVESAIGFSIFTMVLTYFLSIYSAITSRRKFASVLEHLTYDTGSAVRLLCGFAQDGRLAEVSGHLGKLAESITEVAESHTSYPVLGYFHYRHHRYALPRILLVLLDTTTLIRSVLAQDAYPQLRDSIALFQIEAACGQLLDQLETSDDPAAPVELRQAWAGRFHAARRLLAGTGLELTDDPQSGVDRYVELRTQWDARLRRLAEAGGYDWDTIEVAEP